MELVSEKSFNRKLISEYKSLLKVSNIEVVYNHVILALRGVTLDVEKGKVVSLLV